VGDPARLNMRPPVTSRSHVAQLLLQSLDSTSKRSSNRKAVMHLHRILSTLLIGAALLGTPLAASAEPAPVAAQSRPTNPPKLVTADDAMRYAQREKQSPEAAKFEGGGESLYIGGSLVTVLLVLLLVVIIL